MPTPSDSRLLDDYLGLSAQGAPHQQHQHPPQHSEPKSRDEMRRHFEEKAKASSAPLPAPEVEDAVKAAAHGVKVLAPLLAAITKHVDPQDSQQIESLMAKALSRVRADAMTVAQAFRVDQDEAPLWLIAQLSGQLMPVMLSALDRGASPILDGNTSYLTPLLQLAEQAQEHSVKSIAFSGNPEWQILQAMAVSTANVMTEYQAWSYWHADAASIAQMISDHIHDRVIDQTLADLVDRWQLNPAEKAQIGVTLVHHAGEMLARCWTMGMERALETVKEMDRAQQRQVLATGYPLDHVFEDFENLYQGIEVSVTAALRTLSPSRERSTSKPTSNESLR